MDDQDTRVSLTHLNKKPPSKLQQKLETFRGNKLTNGNPHRDQFGQFSNKANRVKKSLSPKQRALLIVGLISVIGVITLLQSSANSTKLYDYQYSMYSCTGFNNSADPVADSKNTPDYSCTDKSAESLTFRLYKGLYATNPPVVIFNQSTQSLAGDRKTPTQAAEVLLAGSPKRTLTNQQFIESIHKDLTGQAASQANISSWNIDLIIGALTRQKLVANLALGATSKQTHRTAFVNYRKQLPRITIQPTAAVAQQARINEAKSLRSKSEQNFTEVRTRAEAALGKAGNAIDNSNLAQANITLDHIARAEWSIAEIDKFINELNSNPWQIDTAANLNRIKILQTEARAVAAYSPDLSDALIKPEVDYVGYVKAYIDNGLNSLNDSRNKTIAAHKTTETKYQAELERLGSFVAAVSGKKQSNMPNGIKHWMDGTYQGKQIHILRIDLNNPKLKVRASTQAERGKTVSDFARLTGAAVAINGDYRDLTVGGYVPKGLAVGNGQVWSGSTDKDYSSFVACTASNDCVIENRLSVTAHDPKYTNVVSGGGGQSGVLLQPGFEWTLKPGDPGCALNVENTTCSDPHPRTGIGLSADRKTMWWVVVEGRQSFTGLSFYDFAKLFKKLNAKWAVNMDGGGSSAMVINGKLISGRPTDEPAERVLTNSIGIIVQP